MSRKITIFTYMNEIEEYRINEIVQVNDNSNYIADYAEDCPFEAKIRELTDYPTIVVQSVKSKLEYELYPQQIQKIIK